MRMFRSFSQECPLLEEVFMLFHGDLPSGRAAAAREHLRCCGACGAEAPVLEALARAIERGPLPEPSEEAVERAVAVFPRATPRPARLGWSLASLLRDSFFNPVPAGVRGEAGGERRLLYRSGDLDLDLEVREAAAGELAFHVTGQVLRRGGAPPADVLAVLWNADAVTAHAGSDAVGVFDLPRVPPGSYRLEVWIPGEERGVRVDRLELGGGPR